MIFIRRGYILVLFVVVSCSKNETSKPDLIYRYMADGMPHIELSIDLERGESTDELRKMIVELFDRFPLGASPNPYVVTGTTIREELEINWRGRSIKFELFPIAGPTYGAMSGDEKRARDLFVATRDELLRVVEFVVGSRASSDRTET